MYKYIHNYTYSIYIYTHSIGFTRLGRCSTLFNHCGTARLNSTDSIYVPGCLRLSACLTHHSLLIMTYHAFWCDVYCMFITCRFGMSQQERGFFWTGSSMEFRFGYWRWLCSQQIVCMEKWSGKHVDLPTSSRLWSNPWWRNYSYLVPPKPLKSQVPRKISCFPRKHDVLHFPCFLQSRSSKVPSFDVLNLLVCHAYTVIILNMALFFGYRPLHGAHAVATSHHMGRSHIEPRASGNWLWCI